MTEKFIEKTISVSTHGRYLLQIPIGPPQGLLIGFHGYAETAENIMYQMTQIPGSPQWVLCSIQALHLFYSPRSNLVVASWMTSTLRHKTIANNLHYVNSILSETAFPKGGPPIVMVGFSQGASMAYRSALLGMTGVEGIIALAGDIPPEIHCLQHSKRPKVLIGQGLDDTWFTEDKVKRDLDRLHTLGLEATPFTFKGGHEWTSEFRKRCGDFLRTL